MKKRLITTILISTLLIGTLSACGNSPQDSAETMSPSVETAEETDIQETDETVQPVEEETNEETGEQEEADASYEAGRDCLYGLNGQEMDLEAAYTNFNHALELGKTEANFYLGVLCHWYNVPERDYEKAKAYYEAAGDNPYAQLALGSLYYDGNGVEQNETKAQELFDAVIAQECVEGYWGSAYIAYFSKKDYDTAFEYFNKALEGKEQIFVADAMNGIGYLYHYGQGVEQDYEQAIEWHKKAAELGNATAMNEIGYIYSNGEGVEVDYTQALEWHERAADLGDATAMNNIGYMYFYGIGVEVDYTQALEWFEKAADLGNTNAMKSLAAMYMDGIGVEQDLDIAQEWYNKAEEAK